jgi:hypothetical protein
VKSKRREGDRREEEQYERTRRKGGERVRFVSHNLQIISARRIRTRAFVEIEVHSLSHP